MIEIFSPIIMTEVSIDLWLMKIILFCLFVTTFLHLTLGTLTHFNGLLQKNTFFIIAVMYCLKLAYKQFHQQNKL